jgi:hypothetical protein
MTLLKNRVSAVLIWPESSRAATAMTQNEKRDPNIQTNAAINFFLL